MPAQWIDGNFMHVVFFWLKDPDNPENRSRFERSLRTYIENSPYILSRHIGRPAPTDREVIDNSWTYSLILAFPDKEAQDNYQSEAGHVQFVKESSGLWEKVVVYDSLLDKG